MLLYGPNVEMDQTKETFGEEYCLLKPLTNSLLGPAIIYAAESVVLHPIQIAHLDGYVYLQVHLKYHFSRSFSIGSQQTKYFLMSCIQFWAK